MGGERGAGVVGGGGREVGMEREGEGRERQRQTERQKGRERQRHTERGDRQRTGHPEPHRQSRPLAV